MENERRNKGPEHIREILKSAKKQWQASNTNTVRSTERFRKIEGEAPGFIQIVFLYIDGDPQYIRTLNLN
jgi:hypothetical protein